jgi:hypothetical protein
LQPPGAVIPFLEKHFGNKIANIEPVVSKLAINKSKKELKELQ